MNNLTADTSMALLKATQTNLPDAASNLQAAKDARKLEQIEDAAKEFEAVFMSEMLKPMFEGIETDSTFGGGKGEEIFRGFMIQEYGKILAETGSIGIADQVKAELIERQGLEINTEDKEDKENKEAAEREAANTEDTAFSSLITNLTTD